MRKSAVRTFVSNRARDRCEYCHVREIIGGYRFHIEHIKPVSRGGINDVSNLAFSCVSCNQAKSNREFMIDPNSGHETKLYNPREQEWNEHFMWEIDNFILVGLTPVGRVTIECLAMNKSIRIASRKFWFEMGVWLFD